MARAATAATIDPPPAVQFPKPLHALILRRLYAVADNGCLQKVLFSRLPPQRTLVRIQAMQELLGLGFVQMRRTTRHSTRSSNLWTITERGRAEYMKLQSAQLSTC